MFNYKNMIQRAIEFFPLWTDIRKRYNKSQGGKFLSSVIEEEIKTEETIQEYIDSYFLYTYVGHEDEVMDYVYMTTVGHLPSLVDVKIYYDGKLYPYAKNISEFETMQYYTFYEDGRIYIKVSDHIDGLDEITISIGDLDSVYTLKRVAVWNIFDEFATFVNTRRYENETNKQLLDRILYITKNLPNGTEDGLKHAIISELMTDYPDITMDEIIIENPTAENLIKPYEDYETLLDMLAEVNRDVYRTKRWDLDYWEYDFESISYIPHVWDKVIYDWQNGVGSYNDLEVMISDKNQTTDAVIHLYRKTLEAFQKYVYDKYIDDTIEFSLVKYNNILNKANVKYKITASELQEITNEDIKLKLHESKKRIDDIPLQDIAVGWGKDIEKINNDAIDDSYTYKIEFKNKQIEDGRTNLNMSMAQVVYKHKVTGEYVETLDLLEERDKFIFNSDYELVNEAEGIIINAIEHLTKSENLSNHEEGITLSPGASKGEGSLSLVGKAGLYLNLNYTCEPVDFPKTLIVDYSGYWNEYDEFVVRGDYSKEVKTIEFETIANQFSFNISNNENLDSQIILKLIDDGEEKQYDISHTLYFETEKTLYPRPLTFKLEVMSPNDVKFSNFKYNNYNIDISTRYGVLEKKERGYKLPNFYNNELIINLETKSAENIILNEIYIGRESEDIKYLTGFIPPKDGCIRELNIKTNGIVNLLKYDDGTLFDIVENYDPVPSYRALSDNAYIRIDLSEYETISSLQPDVGTIETIEESGVVYHHIRLKTNQVAKRILVTGTKTQEAREVTLEDMIRFYIPDYNATYDKVYCSKCSRGFIITRRDSEGNSNNELINIKSEIFTGLKIVKYEMELPSYLGTIYGSENGYENRSNTSIAAFDYISIYPANSQLYHAINEYDTYLSENKFIPIVNNFSPILNTALSFFYRVENFNKNDGTIIRFHNSQNSNLEIKDMPDWSIGTSDSYIAIKHDIDLLNNAVYDISTYNINDYVYLSTSVPIKDSYSITSQTILNTERFMIETNDEHVSIKYDYYDGTSKKEHLLKFEEVYIESDGFNKLIYSNIDTIYHCSFTPFTEKYIIDVPFEILKDSGIIIWKDLEIINKNLKVYMVYSIKKPVAFVFDLEYLYKAIKYDIEAYDEIGQHKLLNKNNDFSINLKSENETNAALRNDYLKCDLITVSCSNPTFEARIDNDSLTLHKYIEEDNILIKTGYYYINGREYYLYSEDDTEDLKNNAFYTSNNIDISGGEIVTYKETNNYVANTEMRLKGMANLYNFNCSENLAYGISTLNYLTSCDSFNEWNTFEMRMRIVKGFNGMALKFTPTIEAGYAFLDITDALVSNKINYISFYASEDLHVSIGKEYKYMDINFNRAIDIKIDHEILYNNSDIRFTTIKNKLPNERYYLIVQNTGIIDDIIISTDKESIYNNHTKNISLLGLDLYEKKPEGTRYRMTLKTDKDYKSYLAALMSDGKIKTTSNLDWYITKLKTYTEDQDFKDCELANIGVNADCIYTGNNPGYIETQPLRLDNLDNIKRIIIKINDLETTFMTGFSTHIYTCDDYNGIYIASCGTQYDNKFNIPVNFLKRYIKIRVDMPAYKYINNIAVFVEYVSSDENPMPIITTHSGYIESKLYDLQQESNCVVKSIDIEDVSNINDIELYIRASRDNERLDVWTNWNRIYLTDSLQIANYISFTNTRFLQYKILVKNRSGYIKFKSIDVEIK